MNTQATRMSDKEAEEFDKYLESLEGFDENSFEGDKLNVTWEVENLNSTIRNNLIQFFVTETTNNILDNKSKDALREKIQNCINILNNYTEKLKIKAKCVEYMFNEPPRITQENHFFSCMSMSAIEENEPDYFNNIPCIAVYNESGLVYANSAYLRITGIGSIKELKELANKTWEEDGILKNGLTEKSYHGKNKQKVYDFVKTLKKGSGYQNEHFTIGNEEFGEKTYSWSSFGLNNSNGSIRIGMDITKETIGKSDEEIRKYLRENYTDKRLDGTHFGFEDSLNELRLELKNLIGDKFEDSNFVGSYKKLNLFAQMGDTFFDKGPFIMNMWQDGKLILANPVYTGVTGYTLDEMYKLIEEKAFYSTLYGDKVEREFVSKRVEGLNSNNPHYNEPIWFKNRYSSGWIRTEFDTYLMDEIFGKKLSFRIGRLDPLTLLMKKICL